MKRTKDELQNGIVDMLATCQLLTGRQIKELLTKYNKGVEKYGISLEEAKLPKSELLQHAKEEAQDLINYTSTILLQHPEKSQERDKIAEIISMSCFILNTLEEALGLVEFDTDEEKFKEVK